MIYDLDLVSGSKRSDDAPVPEVNSTKRGVTVGVQVKEGRGGNPSSALESLGPHSLSGSASYSVLDTADHVHSSNSTETSLSGNILVELGEFDIELDGGISHTRKFPDETRVFTEDMTISSTTDIWKG